LENDRTERAAERLVLKSVRLPASGLENGKKMSEYKTAMLRLSTVFSEEQAEALKGIFNLCFDDIENSIEPLENSILRIQKAIERFSQAV